MEVDLEVNWILGGGLRLVLKDSGVKGWGVVLVLDFEPSRIPPDGQGKEKFGEAVVALRIVCRFNRLQIC